MWFTDERGNKVNTENNKSGISSNQLHDKGSDFVDGCVMDSCNKCGFYHKIGGECIDPNDFTPKLHDKNNDGLLEPKQVIEEKIKKLENEIVEEGKDVESDDRNIAYEANKNIKNAKMRILELKELLGKPIEYLEYQSETKSKALENKKFFEREDGVKIEEPKAIKMEFPHHGNNYYYWQVKRPITW